MKIGTLRVGVEVDQSKLVGGLKQVGNTTSKLGSQLKGFALNALKRGLQAGFIAVTAYVAKSVFQIAKFQKQMANVSTMLDKVGQKHMPVFTEGIKEMAIEFGESTESLTKGLYDILSASVAPEEAMEVLAESSKAAIAGLTDTATAADAITTILNSYALAAENAGDVSDWFFSVVKRGKTTFAELAPNIGKVASLASTANLSLEELGAALATMTRAGVRTDIAITSLRSLMSAFVKPTNDSAEAAKALGIELSTTTLKEEGLLSVIEKLEDATPEQTAAIFGNVRALTGLSAILKNTTGFMKDLDIMETRAGRTQEAFEKQTKTLSFQFKRLWQEISIAATVTGEELSEEIQKLVNYIIENKDEILDFAKNFGAAMAEIMKNVRELHTIWSETWENMKEKATDAADFINQKAAALGIAAAKQAVKAKNAAKKAAKETKDAVIKNAKAASTTQIEIETNTQKILADMKATQKSNEVAADEEKLLQKANTAKTLADIEEDLTNIIAENITSIRGMWTGMADYMLGLVKQMAAKMIMSHLKEVGAYMYKAAAAVWSWAAGIPFAGPAIAAGVIVAGAALVKKHKFATGVRNFAGGMALVGEQGPELVQLPRGSDVFTNSVTKQMISNVGDTREGDIYITISPKTGDRQDWGKIVRNDIIPELQRYKRKTATSPFV